MSVFAIFRESLLHHPRRDRYLIGDDEAFFAEQGDISIEKREFVFVKANQFNSV
jgi:hypothetical protein